ncbi:MAG: Tol-Pal system protein TolB [Campylobacterota bacterium]
MKKIILLIVSICSYMFAFDATIELKKDLEERSKIAIFDRSGNNSSIAKQLHDMLVADFKTTGNFLVDEGYQRDRISSEEKFKEYDYLIRYSVDDGARLTMDVGVYRAADNELIDRKSFFIGTKKRYPFLSHTVVSSINDFFGYPAVTWMNDYIIFSKYTGMGKAEIFIADYTLTYQQKVISGGLNIFPKWLNDEKDSFVYTSMNKSMPTLYKVDLFTGEREMILENEGMLVCSDTKNNGKELLLTLAYNDQPEIYHYNMQSKKKKRITYFNGIDVNGQFLNDNEVVFVSERLGYPNVYKKDISQQKVQQLVFHGRNNHSVTAHGKYMVYTSRDSDNSFSKNSFNLYLISLETNYIRPLTATGVNQFPKFSKSGDTVLFIKNYENESALGLIRINQNRSFLFPLRGQKIQSMDW